jgi:hypothetical protein
MTIAPKSIGPAVVAQSAAAAIYTSGTNITTVITRASVVNITAAGATLKLWVVRSGGTNTNSNIVYGASAAGETVSAGPSDPVILNVLAGLVLNPGDAIWGLSDTASALNFTASGWTQ